MIIFDAKELTTTFTAKELQKLSELVGELAACCYDEGAENQNGLYDSNYDRLLDITERLDRYGINVRCPLSGKEVK